MRKRILITLIAGLAASPSSATQGNSPLLGTWTIDLDRSQIPVEARPQNVTVTYSDIGDGKWNTYVAIVGGDGGEIKATSTYTLDGMPAPGTGYPNVDSIAVKVPAPHVMIAAFSKEGIPRSTRTYIVSPDGKTMMENIVWLNIGGDPEIATNHFNRIK